MNIHNIFKNVNFKVFFISLIGQFVITSLLYWGISAPQFLDFLKFSRLSYAQLVSPQVSIPQPTPTPDVFKPLVPKLEQKTDSFELKKQTSLIKTAYADTNYGEATSYAAVDLDTGDVLFSRNGDQRLPIASLTKVMTAIVALDLASPDQVLTVNHAATLPEPTKLYLKEGEHYTLDQMLRGMLISSANDCAEVIRQNMDQLYHGEVFIKAMNKKAEVIGLKNTHFANPQGYDSSQNYSSALDLALLTHYALTNYPQIVDIVSRDHDDLSTQVQDDRMYLNNWNGLLGVYPGVYGVKIGNTGDAGKTTLVAARRGEHHVLAVILGAPGLYERDLGAAGLLDDSFVKFGLPQIGVTKSELKQKYQSWKY